MEQNNYGRTKNLKLHCTDRQIKQMVGFTTLDEINEKNKKALAD